MKKISVSYATLALVNAAKFDSSSMDSYAQQNDKMAADLKSQYLKSENDRLEAIEEQQARDAWRQDSRPPTAQFVVVSTLTGEKGVPDSYAENNDALSASIKKTHNDAEVYRQDQVDAQEDADQWRKGWTPSSGPVANTLIQEQNPADFDTYGTQSSELADKIKKQHMQAEEDRYAAIEAQEIADQWRAGSTKSPKSLMQLREIPDSYTVHNGVLSDSILKTHTDAETARQADVDAQQKADAWRNGFTPSPAPSLMQVREIPDSYTVHNGVLSDSIKKTHTDAETKRQSDVDAQQAADAWRNGFTPSPPVSLNQMRAIPDGYTHNNKVLSDSILDTHTNAESVRKAAVDAQQAADVWRNGWTDNTGPVTHPYGLNQMRAIPDGYTHNNKVLSDSILDTHTTAETARKASVDAQQASDVWRNGWTDNTGPVTHPYGLYQRRAIPDGYTFNNGVLSDSILKTHTDAETARQASVDAQQASDAWRAGSTPNSGPVINYAQYQNMLMQNPRYQMLVQGQPSPLPTDYDFNFKVMNDITNTHNKLWWAEQNADIAKQEAVDAWRNGWTANQGPELPYTM